MLNDFPRILTLLRKEKGISQKQAAEDLGLAQALLSHYEKGKRECGLEFLLKAANYYNVSTDYLLDFNSNQTISHQEDDLLRIFRSLSSTQKDICLEQCKAFVKINYKEKEGMAKSS